MSGVGICANGCNGVVVVVECLGLVGGRDSDTIVGSFDTAMDDGDDDECGGRWHGSFVSNGIVGSI